MSTTGWDPRRPVLAAHGQDRWVGAYALPFGHGVRKPGARLFHASPRRRWAWRPGGPGRCADGSIGRSPAPPDTAADAGQDSADLGGCPGSR
ncbi:hypothetical protein [Streptomyces sp. URMC 129]|uniref:hypothetical protein n=1 Tax=Streptomyces sp. URMC 129 TaxID=3423407 RepID=UPI003F1B706F